VNKFTSLDLLIL